MCLDHCVMYAYACVTYGCHILYACMRTRVYASVKIIRRNYILRWGYAVPISYGCFEIVLIFCLGVPSHPSSFFFNCEANVKLTKNVYLRVENKNRVNN